MMAPAAITSGVRAKARPAAAGMISIAVISRTPTTLIDTATRSASATVRTSRSRDADTPAAAARSASSVEIKSRDHRQAISPETAAAPVKITAMSRQETARMSPKR